MAHEGVPVEATGDLFLKLKDWHKDDAEACRQWKKEAREAYDFVAGTQWSSEDANKLAEQNRPAITFNRVQPMVNTVCGLEVGNRQEVRFIPREMGDVAVNELLTEAARWVRDNCNAEDEESDAFRDLVITGMGWIDTALSYDENPKGDLLVTRIDPLEMIWDHNAIRKNMADARRIWRVKDVSIEEARELYPDADEADLHANWADKDADVISHDEVLLARPTDTGDRRGNLNTVRMVEVQWWEKQRSWQIVDPFTGAAAILTDEEWETVRGRLEEMGEPEPQAVRQNTRVYWRAILGARVLDVWPGPDSGGFTWKCMTGERDRNARSWYGIVRAMLDPQRWANKFLSQTLHIMNAGAKGGIMAEVDAFDDVRTAEEEWSDPTAIVLTAPGALSTGKIQTRPVNPMPPGLPDLLTLALSSIRDCTGINLELLGLVERDQPGIVETARKQAGMTILAGLFDAQRRYRKEQGQLLLWYITKFLSDERLIRIGGPDHARYVPLVQQPGMPEYDVIVDDTPTSPNAKERAWQTMVQMMPWLSRMNVPPAVYLELLKYSPLPSTVTGKIGEIVTQQQRMQGQQQQVDPVRMVAEGSARLDMAKAKQVETEAQMSVTRTQLEAQEVKARIEAMRAKALADLAKAGATTRDSRTDQMLAVLDALDSVVDGYGQRQSITGDMG